ncbi:MAG: 3D domain-containing protein [Candidatus Muiribacteriota bacterium]
MKFLFSVFIIAFGIIYFNLLSEKPAESEYLKHNSFFIKKQMTIDRENLSGELFEYYKVKNDGNEIKKILVDAVFHSDFNSWKFSETRTVLATAYTPGEESCGVWADGYTYTDLFAQYGLIAVDPTNVALGSIVYVQNYGLAFAADIGGQIKGNRIDLCFPDVDIALEFGVENLDFVELNQGIGGIK